MKEDECWIWSGAKNSAGYGQIRLNMKLQYAHRALFEVHKGPIPEGMNLRHSCDTPACCNPDHLEPGSQAQNIRDMAIRGRSGSAKLTPAQVRKIRALRGALTRKQIARAFSVSESSIDAILSGRNYSHVD